VTRVTKFTVKRAGKLWLISRDGEPVVGVKSKAEATKRAKAMQKKAESREAPAANKPRRKKRARRER
jgi:hypothetical protein